MHTIGQPCPYISRSYSAQTSSKLGRPFLPLWAHTRHQAQGALYPAGLAALRQVQVCMGQVTPAPRCLYTMLSRGVTYPDTLYIPVTGRPWRCPSACHMPLRSPLSATSIGRPPVPSAQVPGCRHSAHNTHSLFAHKQQGYKLSMSGARPHIPVPQCQQGYPCVYVR